jgi:hypothetical protein
MDASGSWCDLSSTTLVPAERNQFLVRTFRGLPESTSATKLKTVSATQIFQVPQTIKQGKNVRASDHWELLKLHDKIVAVKDMLGS